MTSRYDLGTLAAGTNLDGARASTGPPASSSSMASQNASASAAAAAAAGPRPGSRGFGGTPANVSRNTVSTSTGAAARHGKTPGTHALTTGTSTISSGSPSAIVAIVESRALGGEIGMACIDLKRPVLTLSQFADNATYSKVLAKLQLYQPIEIIMPNTAFDNNQALKLYNVINEKFPLSNLVTVQRKYFNETKGLQYIRNLVLKDNSSSIEIEVAGKYYSLATAAALLKYLEFIQNTVYAPHSLDVVMRGSEQSMMIDLTTCKHLELLANARDPSSKASLYGVLNHCYTIPGARLLRSNILQPPTDLNTIETRLDAVEELTTNDDMFFGLQDILSKFLDVGHLIALLITIPKQHSITIADTNITNLIHLKHVLDLIPQLRQTLSGASSALLQGCAKMLEDERFAQIRAKIDEAISDDTKFQKGILLMRSQKCFAVKPGINGLLDVARRTYTETVEDIYNLTSQYATKFVLPLKTAFSASRGFYITTPVSMVPGGPAQTSGSARPATAAADDSDDDDDDDDDADDEVGNEVNSDNRARQPASSSRPALGNFGLPKIFQQVVRSKKTLSFTSSDMIKLNNRVNESLQETYLMSNAVLANVLLDIRDMISSLYKLTEVLAILDMLQSFAHHATLSRQAVRPEFTDTLAVKAGGHTIIEHLNSADEASVVTNDVFMSSGCNFQIITGPNMSGKSTYLRQIAIMQVVAQMGCLVPAEYASLRISDHLFSRIGSDDHIESNSSTFMLEMRETAYILQHATNRSLIIIDELGRGTSAQEAVGICHAICEYLLSLKAFTFFATHFEELTLLDSLYPNVANFHLEVQNLGSDSARPVFTHVIRKGPSKETHYGIKLAEVAGFPAQVLERARNALSVIETQGQPDESAAPEFAVDRAVFQLASKLVQVAKESRMDEQSLRAYLLTLQAQHSWLQALL